MDGVPKGFEAQALRLDVEDFLHAEADLVDDRKFDQWLALFSEDLQYRMPIVRNIAAPSIANEYLSGPLDVSWFDEGKKLRRPWHAPSEHGQFADTAVTHYGRHVVRKHTGHRRKVAGRISQSAGERDDGGLAFGDAVEIAHDAAYGRSGSFLAWFNAASLRSFI
jgi:hypothetical protein